MLRQKKKVKLSQAFTQKSGRGCIAGREGHSVDIWWSEGERDKGSFTSTTKTQRLKAGKESKKGGDCMQPFWRNCSGFSGGLKRLWLFHSSASTLLRTENWKKSCQSYLSLWSTSGCKAQLLEVSRKTKSGARCSIKCKIFFREDVLKYYSSRTV